jgi:hypothetical protein
MFDYISQRYSFSGYEVGAAAIPRLETPEGVALPGKLLTGGSSAIFRLCHDNNHARPSSVATTFFRHILKAD